MQNSAIRLTHLFSFALLCHASASHSSDMDNLTRLINQKQATLQVKQQAIAAGQERAVLCSVCHGEDGNSTKPDVPNLAGQNPVYLLDQIEKFSDGRRKNYVMNSLAKSFSTEDKVNLAIFYNSMPVKLIEMDKELAKKGKPIYEKSCSSCHGEQGEGNINFARIAGQQPLYVLHTLKRFRDNANNSPGQEASKRCSNIMEPIVKGYSDKELEMLAAYVTSMGSK
jgi:cytochrome c553